MEVFWLLIFLISLFMLSTRLKGGTQVAWMLQAKTGRGVHQTWGLYLLTEPCITKFAPCRKQMFFYWITSFIRPNLSFHIGTIESINRTWKSNLGQCGRIAHNLTVLVIFAYLRTLGGKSSSCNLLIY